MLRTSKNFMYGLKFVVIYDENCFVTSDHQKNTRGS